jgi:hypothetical protein
MRKIQQVVRLEYEMVGMWVNLSRVVDGSLTMGGSIMDNLGSVAIGGIQRFHRHHAIAPARGPSSTFQASVYWSTTQAPRTARDPAGRAF